MTQEEMDDAYRQLDEYYDGIRRVNRKYLRIVKRLKGENTLRLLEEMLNGLEHYRFIGVQQKPVGKFQSESDIGAFKHSFVKQWATGMEGDSFSGIMSFKLRKNKYLLVEYSC